MLKNKPNLSYCNELEKFEEKRMRFENNIFAPGRRAFTLIELLVVISIIAILAGLVLSGVMGVKAKGMVGKAKVDVVTIAAAVTQYETEYGLPPVSTKVWGSSAANKTINPDYGDFSYGTNMGVNVDPLTGSYGNPNYRTNNSEVIAVLRNGGPTKGLADLASTLNSKKISFLDAPLAPNNISGGVGLDGIFRDPWGSPYIISIDLDKSGTTTDGFYRRLIESKVRPAFPNYPVEVAASVVVWSFGPDGRVDPNPNLTTPEGLAAVAKGPEAILKLGDNKDNVLSWAK